MLPLRSRCPRRASSGPAEELNGDHEKGSLHMDSKLLQTLRV